MKKELSSFELQMCAALRAAGAGGYALYRYGSLFQNSAWPQLAEAERAALTAANAAAGPSA